MAVDNSSSITSYFNIFFVSTFYPIFFLQFCTYLWLTILLINKTGPTEIACFWGNRVLLELGDTVVAVFLIKRMLLTDLFILIYCGYIPISKYQLFKLLLFYVDLGIASLYYAISHQTSSSFKCIFFLNINRLIYIGYFSYICVGIVLYFLICYMLIRFLLFRLLLKIP